ncbi:cryptochrome/deoxyribodipyrimidine photo-lyase family protein [Aestuariibaculum sediminum]|uniref:Deoxyribodipyrimidine photo-lyase n=1 Tax=Aestuariibaculum sediminum TaxID=2770637 RepID=A0A8J6U7B1_9FLAO|nr:FAD-binding domain-containing protein [Aestuariibaculum sediminum]MBD0831675.1 deoxyribodipyrimidine photo-lyase [Aestuariibaculum sediminum]
MKDNLSIVWLKRDLRLWDNEAIFNAIHSNQNVLLIYVFETFLITDKHYSKRHWDFVKQSLEDLNNTLYQYNSKVLIIENSIEQTIKTLQKYYQVTHVYSHQETGLFLTFERDLAFGKYCKTQNISWQESINNGVQRGLKNRATWYDDWTDFMGQPEFNFNPGKNQLLSITHIEKLEHHFKLVSLVTTKNTSFQKGGTSTGLKCLNSFLNDRNKSYMFNISKPRESRTSCSRISPYLAWGNLSVKQVLNATSEVYKNKTNNRHINAFKSRLRWQAHFIQKFEMEHQMEFRSVNKGYTELNKPRNLEYQQAWKAGKTGFPLVDACMRCLNETGYLNFRMRALVVSFFTHSLWQPWEDCAAYLASVFLDFEPGIHYPQIQMQAGETGINALRIYSPLKNSKALDPEGKFIKQWVKELVPLDATTIHDPSSISYFDQQLTGFEIGVTYPTPIINDKLARKYASNTLWKLKDSPFVKQENRRILKRHTLKDRSIMLKNS